MQIYRRIAVPLDGTVESEHALRWAIVIAQRARCTIDLVHVKIQPPLATELYGAPALIGQAVEEHRTATMQRLSQLADEVGKSGSRAEVSVLEGKVPTTLERHFETTAADLIVIARHDRSRLEHLLFGSVAESVSRRTHIPVLIVRPPDGEAVLEPYPEIRQILLPFDGSPFSEQIIPHAATLAQLMHAEITLLGVLEPMAAMATAALDAGPDPSVPLSHAPGDSGAGEATSPELEQAATTLRSWGLPVRTVVLSAGRPAHAIIVYAEQGGFDLIALTTHGRGAIQRAIMGSVSEAVLRSARLPILMFRPKAS